MQFIRARVGRIEYFSCQRLLVGNDYIDINMARVKWFEEHSAKQKYSSPVETWCSGLFKPFGPATFMPVERIKEICIACDISLMVKKYSVNPMQKRYSCEQAIQKLAS